MKNNADNNKRGSRWRQMAGLSMAHFLSDGYASFPIPLLSMLAPVLGVSYAAASWLVGMNSAWAAVANVLVGLGSDRWKHLGRATVLISATLTVICLSMVGMVPNYWLLAGVMAVGMFGCGALHPPAFSLAGEVFHPQRHHGVSIVMTAGIAAYGLGPVFVSQVVHRVGLHATPLCAVPGLAIVGAAAFFLRDRMFLTATVAGEIEPAAEKAEPKKRRLWLVLLFTNAVSRAFAQVGVLVIISYLVEMNWGLLVTDSGWGIGLLQVGAGLGGLLGAALTRAGDERRTLLWCPLVNLLMLLPMAFTTGRIWYLWLFIYGIAANGPQPSVIGMAQRIAPHRSALVSGLLVGPASAIGVCLASLTTPVLVKAVGQASTMFFLAAPILVAWLTALRLPRHREPG